MEEFRAGGLMSSYLFSQIIPRSPHYIDKQSEAQRRHVTPSLLKMIEKVFLQKFPLPPGSRIHKRRPGHWWVSLTCCVTSSVSLDHCMSLFPPSVNWDTFSLLWLDTEYMLETLNIKSQE